MTAIGKMTRKQLMDIPFRKFNTDIGSFDSLIIIPTRRKHDSKFLCMEYIAVKDDKPVCKIGGISDVLHFDGIGGYGHYSKELPNYIAPKGWCIDCLPGSGLLRIFLSEKFRFQVNSLDISSLSIYAISEKEGIK